MKKKEFYLNNPNLKAANVKYNFTKHEIEEYLKCMNDPIYFIRNYCKIQTLDSQEELLFDLFPYQEVMIDMFENNSLNLAMLPRQMGKCVIYATPIKIRNKKTNEIKEIAIGEYYSMLAAKANK